MQTASTDGQTQERVRVECGRVSAEWGEGMCFESMTTYSSAPHTSWSARTRYVHAHPLTRTVHQTRPTPSTHKYRDSNALSRTPLGQRGRVYGSEKLANIRVNVPRDDAGSRAYVSWRRDLRFTEVVDEGGVRPRKQKVRAARHRGAWYEP